MSLSTPKEIRIVAVLGSIRPDNYTAKALHLAIDEIKKNPEVSVEVIDPAQEDLSYISDEESPASLNLQKKIKNATGVILSTPEYHGSYSSIIKLIIDNLGYPSALEGKPVVLLGVASGFIGAIKALEHLRSVCSHVGAIVLPGAVSVSKVERLFDQNGKMLDAKMEERIRSVGKNLYKYITAHIWPNEVEEEITREK